MLNDNIEELEPDGGGKEGFLLLFFKYYLFQINTNVNVIKEEQQKDNIKW